MKFLAPAICLGLILSFFSNFSNAKDDLDHAGFDGTVTDANGAVIAGATVKIRNLSGRREVIVLTDNQGRYSLRMMPPGSYDLTVEATGFQTVQIKKVIASAGMSLKRDFQLSPATVTDEVIIESASDAGDTGLIDTTRTVVGGSISSRSADALPVASRNPFELVFLLPGASLPALSDSDLAEGDNKTNYRRTPEESGIFSLNGGTPFSNNLTIEGLDNNDDRAARERFIPSMLAVEEVQVVANQFSAEYGRASGGRVNMRLRGGSDRLHGQFQYFFRDESLNANGYFRNADPARGIRLPYQNHNPGVSLGAPLIQGKISIFGAYEYDDVYDRAEIRALLPVGVNPVLSLPRPNGEILGFTAIDKDGATKMINGGAAVGLYDETVTTPKTAHTLQSRADFRIIRNHESFGLLTLARNRDERGFSGGRRTLETLRSSGRSSHSLAFSDNFIISPKMMNNARVQYSSLRPNERPDRNSPVIIIDIDDPRDVIRDPNSNPLTRSGTLLAGSSNSSGTDRIEDRFQFQDTLSYVLGSQTLRFGVDLQSIDSNFNDLSDTSGTFTFSTPADFIESRPSRFEQRFFTGSKLKNTYFSFFHQNDWRVRPNLTLSYGIRWDNESIVRDRNNIGPRFSFAWDPHASGKSVIRGGYGIFYNRALLRTVDDYTLTSKSVRIDTNNDLSRSLLSELIFPEILAANDPRVKQMGVRESGFLRRLGGGFRIPESYQASLGFERVLTRGMKLEINYVFNRGLHLWREINANAPRLPAGFSDFTSYLTSKDFENSKDPATGLRPIASSGNADTVRFDMSTQSSRTVKENGKNIVIFGLNNQSTSNSTSGLKAALAAIRDLRPDPALTQIEELQSRGNSFYHGLSFELQGRLFAGGTLRASYTLSRLIDDGVVNTSSPLVVGDFKRERAPSLLDARHRISLSGNYRMTQWLGALAVSGILTVTSSRPFNIGANGNDRNLDDVDNDRPEFNGLINAIAWRKPGQPLPQSLAESFSLPAIGYTGNLRRNAGRGPSQYSLNLRLSRKFSLNEHHGMEFLIEAFNPFNSTLFNFGAEFVNFNPTSLGNFLVPQRTIKPRTLRIGARIDF